VSVEFISLTSRVPLWRGAAGSYARNRSPQERWGVVVVGSNGIDFPNLFKAIFLSMWLFF